MSAWLRDQSQRAISSAFKRDGIMSEEHSVEPMGDLTPELDQEINTLTHDQAIGVIRSIAGGGWLTPNVLRLHMRVQQHDADEVELMSEEHHVEPMLQFFEYAHLPAHLQSMSMMFSSLAHELVDNLPRNPERTAALRKLLSERGAASAR
jgi:hypothetical protein